MTAYNIIIPTLNRGKDLLPRLLADLPLEDPNLQKIIVIDNGDQGLELSSRITYRPYKTNLGVATSWNKGIEESFSDPRIKFCLVLNDDIVLGKTSKQLQQVYNQSPKEGIIHGRGFYSFMIFPQTIQKVGWFDENFWPAYVEDVDYALRVRKKDLPYIKDPLLTPTHMDVSSSLNKDSESKRFIEAGANRNRKYFARKWGAFPPDWQTWVKKENFDELEPQPPKIAVLIATYYRKDGKTKELLSRTINSLNRQVYRNFEIIMVGDDYKPVNEFFEYDWLFDEDLVVTMHNLPHSPERSKWEEGTPQLWNVGGTGAYNKAIDIAQQRNIDWIAYLDHDDEWDPFYLKYLATAIAADRRRALCASRGRHFNGAILPPLDIKSNTLYYPEPAKVLKSAVAYNVRRMPIKAKEEPADTPADMRLWSEITTFMKQNGLRGHLIDKITVTHDDEHSAHRNNVNLSKSN